MCKSNLFFSIVLLNVVSGAWAMEPEKSDPKLEAKCEVLNALTLAMGQQDLARTKLLIKDAADLEIINGLNADVPSHLRLRYNSDFKSTPLLTACHFGSLDAVKLLLVAKADVNKVDNWSSPLWAATSQKWIKVMKKLIQSGADLYYTSPKGETALMNCISAGISSTEPESVVILCAPALRLSSIEKDSVKNWLLVDYKLREAGRALPKDLKMVIVKAIHRLFAEDMYERTIRMGAQKALAKAIAKNEKNTRFELSINRDPQEVTKHTEHSIKLLKQCLNLDQLEKFAKTRTLFPKRDQNSK